MIDVKKSAINATLAIAKMKVREDFAELSEAVHGMWESMENMGLSTEDIAHVIDEVLAEQAGSIDALRELVEEIRVEAENDALRKSIEEEIRSALTTIEDAMSKIAENEGDNSEMQALVKRWEALK